MHRSVFPAAAFTDLLSRPGAVWIFAVSGGLFPIGLYQLFQHLLMAALAVIVVKKDHVFAS